MDQLSLLDVNYEYPWEELLPKEELLDSDPVPTYLWDIPHTIPQLGYLTHNHYRYYGKFPSVVAGMILNKYPPKHSNQYVLDNFCGSGTTLVEARLRNIKAYGIDISWLAMLASNVKVRNIDIQKIKKLLNDILKSCKMNIVEDAIDNFTEKWFTSEATKRLKQIQIELVKTEECHEKDFLVVAFLGIVRRVSKAYDGEVRPHINKDKKERNVLRAFEKKVCDMIERHGQFMNHVKDNVCGECFLHDNTNISKGLDKFNDNNCHLVISHPPYLNSFNYSPVYNLEFYWGKPFESAYAKTNQLNLNKKELKAHPADEKITKSYFKNLVEGYKETFSIQPKDSHLAIVIGDCTRNKQVVPVINTLIDKISAETGYVLHELHYRTTHYGLGKYAYNHRADYHGDRSVKKDGIIIFKKTN